MGCASTATRPGPLRSPSRPRSSTECSTWDARTPSASPDQQWGTGAPLPLPPPRNTLPADLQGMLAADEGEAHAELDQELPEMLEQTLFELALARRRSEERR